MWRWAESEQRPDAPRLERWLRNLDLPLLVLAGLSLALYLAELRGVWPTLRLERTYLLVSLAIDLVFVADLVAKCLVLGRPYVTSPWFLVDAMSTLPVLATASLLPEYVEALRLARTLRFFRALRVLRLLRIMRTLRLLKLLKAMPMDEECRAFERALYAVVIGYSLAFLGLMLHLQHNPVHDARTTEFYAVLASVLGMGAIMVVMRYHLPEISSRQVRLLLDIALPHQVAERLRRQPETYEPPLRMPATIVFCDVQGFTRAVERLGSDLGTLKTHLERVLDAVVEVHLKHDLIVDKFIGDAVMSFRGGDLVTGDAAEHAYRVVRASIEAQRAVAELSDPFFSGMKIGGASSPECLIGAFGTSKRLTYTVLGDAVNLAARLEPACGQVGARNLFCETTCTLTRARPDLVWRCFGVLRVQGKGRTVRVYEAMDLAEAGDRRWLEQFQLGLAAFADRRVEAATPLFEAAGRPRARGGAAAPPHPASAVVATFGSCNTVWDDDGFAVLFVADRALYLRRFVSE